MSARFSIAQIERLEFRRLLAATAASSDQFVATDSTNGRLVLLDRQGNQTPVTEPADNPDDASFSPDRTKILFDANGDNIDTTYEIYTVNIDGTGFTRLTNNSFKDFNPHFSPDGSKIVFVSARDGNDEIYTMNADGTNQTRLTNNTADDNDPRFSPDGSKIIFDSDSTGKTQIYTMDAATGGNLTRLTNNTADDSDPVYSPDGSRIAYNEGGDIWIMDASGAQPLQLSHGSDMPVTGDDHPDFSPDGTLIAFNRNESEGGDFIFVTSAADGSGEAMASENGVINAGWASAPAFAGIDHRILIVNGTAGDDNISIANDGMTVTITLNGKSEPFAISDFSSLQIFAGAGNDTLDGSQGAIAFYASGDAGNDELIGGQFNDTLTAGAGRNTLFGGDGDDRLNGSGGRDFLYGDNGNDREYGNGGNDYMVGGAGVDRMWGGDGDDLLSGNTGNDKMYGENGNDQLIGGTGNDLVYGGPGADTMNGQAGTDSIDTADPGDVLAGIEVRP